MSQLPTGTGPVQARTEAQVASLIDLAARAFTAGDLARPEQIAMQLTSQNPSDPRGWWLLGRVRTAQGQLSEAESALTRGWFLLPTDPDIAAARGHLRLRQGKNAEAAEFFRQAATARPDHPDARLMHAEALRRDGKAKEALAELGDATTAVACHVRGKCLHDTGDLAGAESELRKGLAQTAAPALRSQLNLRLGLVLDALGRYPEAFEAIRASRASTPASFDEGLFRQRLESFRAFFVPQTIAALKRPGKLTRRPVFVAALAQSGANLLDRMIAAHPKCAAAGEANVLPGLIRSWLNPNDPRSSYPEVLRTFDARRLDGVVNAYLSATDQYAGAAERLVDKHLSNWMHVGLIATVFPDATIIHLERDPMDTGLSCFERLSNQGMPWSADLISVGRMLALCEWMMEHWHTVYPGRILRVRYEELVKDPRQQMGRVVEAMGLQWDDTSLSHERLGAARRGDAEGAEVEQEARRINDSTVGRAARFAGELAPMRTAYEEHKARLRGA